MGNNFKIFDFSSLGKRPQDLKCWDEKTKNYSTVGDGTKIKGMRHFKKSYCRGSAGRY
jgi:acyl-[acyl carrier protein]--UDP-N-acetylglucosamine O-acyltransferase